MPASSTTWVTLRTFDTQPLAELAKIQVMEAGIPCRILNAELVSMHWLLGNAVGYVPLQVPENYLEAAEQALGGAAVDLPPSECPKCGEPLDADGPCPMCGHDVEAAPIFAQKSETSEENRETPADDEDAADDDHSPGLLAGLRNFGKPAISAYLVVVFLMFIVSALGMMMILLDGFL
jgi:hypothetical protein